MFRRQKTDFIIIYLSVHMCCASGTTRYLSGKKCNQFVNKIAGDNVLDAETGVYSLLDCLLVCARNDFCQSLFFTAKEGRCQTNTVAFFPGSSLEALDGTVYYEISSGKCSTSGGYLYNRVAKLCYKIHHDVTASWVPAREICSDEGGDLVVLNTEEKFNHIVDTIRANLGLNSTSGFFVGASDHVTEDDWRWVNGEPVSMSRPPWGIDRPNKKSASQDYASISRKLNHQLEDSGHEKFPFICEHSFS